MMLTPGLAARMLDVWGAIAWCRRRGRTTLPLLTIALLPGPVTRRQLGAYLARPKWRKRWADRPVKGPL